MNNDNSDQNVNQPESIKVEDATRNLQTISRRKVLLGSTAVAATLSGSSAGNAPTAFAQGTPARSAPSGAPRMPGKVPFKGTSKLDVRDSTPDWEPFIPARASEGSPNV